MLFQLLIILLKSRTEGEEFKSSKFIFSSFLDLFLDLEVSFPFLHDRCQDYIYRQRYRISIHDQHTM